jgi:arylformamidase
MRIEDYPPQEPLSAMGAAYQARVLALGEGVQVPVEAAYGDDPYQSIALFPAPQPTGETLLFFHGGGWTGGYKEWMHFMAPAFNALGITFASAGYRLAPRHVFPVQRDDAADAVAWLHGQVHAHGGDPGKMFIGGHSSGGHLAALLAATSAWRRPRGLPAQPLRGCLPVSGTYRFGEGSGLAMRPRFLGPDEQADVRAAPLAQLEPRACPPFLVTHGSRDFPHLVRQAAEFVQVLRQAGVPAELETLEDCDHFDASAACGDPAQGWVSRAAAWMRDQVDNTAPTTGDPP